MPALTIQSPVLDMAEGISTASDPDSGLLTKLVAVGVVIVVSAVAAKKWFFPYTIEHLEDLVKSIDDLIEESTTLEWNLLGVSARDFRQVLERYVWAYAHLGLVISDFCFSDSSRPSYMSAYAHLNTR